MADLTAPVAKPWLPGIIICLYAIFAVSFAAGLIINIQALSSPTRELSETSARHGRSNEQFRAVSERVNLFERTQSASHLDVADSSKLAQLLSAIQVELQVGKLSLARSHIADLNRQLDQLEPRLRAAIPGPPLPGDGPVEVPILIYHDPPPNFDAQLTRLESRGYTAISMDQLHAAIDRTRGLPAKPFVITFDDGFSSQLQAFNILAAHHMPATFYIISGGSQSQWCLGADRRYNDPLQPSVGCGDSYMNWDEIKRLDRSGLITIGGHTVDHKNLASLPVEAQRVEIMQNKATIESHLGHPIKHFAYPYGSFTGATLALVREAGYIDAVSTLPGTSHSAGTLFTLRRVREPDQLP